MPLGTHGTELVAGGRLSHLRPGGRISGLSVGFRVFVVLFCGVSELEDKNIFC